jgi:aminoglycoside 3-N-acetyltransferase
VPEPTSEAVGYRDFIGAFRGLGLGRHSRVIAHASLSAFGEVAGGADTLLGAMLSSFQTVIVPTFTIKCMVIAPDGPDDNAITPQEKEIDNGKAEFFDEDLPADRAMGRVAEAMLSHPQSHRSVHPLLSFAGVNADPFLAAQTIEDPWGPVGSLADADGDLLLMGVDHRSNVSLHYAEQRAGRRQFLRWALTKGGIVACPGWSGCRDGFAAIGPRLGGLAGRVEVGPGWIETVPLRDLINLAVGWIREDPQALLCERPSCVTCRAVRASLNAAP